jgi:hypothetical protein
MTKAINSILMIITADPIYISIPAGFRQGHVLRQRDPAEDPAETQVLCIVRQAETMLDSKHTIAEKKDGLTHYKMSALDAQPAQAEGPLLHYIRFHSMRVAAAFLPHSRRAT